MDEKIIASWGKNTTPWVAAVRNGEIDSRLLVTNRAIVDAVRSLSPATGLDIGCGEGWLVRALDGVDFRVMSYEDIAGGQLDLQVDVAVCNFSLLGDDSVAGLFRAAPTYLKPGGTLVVQTMHPVVACGDAPYIDGWREGSWDGFNEGFTDPPPWYFRTLASWVRLFSDHGLQLRELREPLHPNTGKPASLILMGSLTTF